MLLGRLQRLLEQQNGATSAPAIDQFLLTKAARDRFTGAQSDAVEQVLVSDDPESPELGVFIDPDTLALAERALPRLQDTSHLDAYCVATEAVSHFVLLTHRAALDAQVSLLELELQAEVDKFVHLSAELRLAHGSPEQTHLFDKLFERYSLRSHVSAEESDRYKTATDIAARFCLKIQREPERIADRVRRFFASSLQDKLRTVIR